MRALVYCYIAILIALNIMFTCGQSWNFEDAGNPDVTFAPSDNMVTMNEELEPDIRLIAMTYTGAASEVNFTRFFGDPENLGLEARLEDGVMYVYVTIQQDFENEGQVPRPAYRVNVEAGETTVVLTIVIVNIDDNSPTMSPSCKIEENLDTGDIATGCVYSIYDVDRFDFFPDIARNEIVSEGIAEINEIFRFEIEPVNPTNPNVRSAELHVMRPLDFEMVSMYLLNWLIVDSGGNSGNLRVVVEVQDIPDEPPRLSK